MRSRGRRRCLQCERAYSISTYVQALCSLPFSAQPLLPPEQESGSTLTDRTPPRRCPNPSKALVDVAQSPLKTQDALCVMPGP